MQLENVAQKIILENIRHAILNSKKLVNRVRELDDGSVTLKAFLSVYPSMGVRDIYKRSSWSRLLVQAGKKQNFSEPQESIITKGLWKLCSFDDPLGLEFFKHLLHDFDGLQGNLTNREMALASILYYILYQKPPKDLGFPDCISALKQLFAHNPTLTSEAVELMELLMDNSRVYPRQLDIAEGKIPLSIYASYIRDQILAAVGYYNDNRRPAQREGVLYIPELKTDVLLITLNKSEKDYSPSIMYQDYVVNERLFHWQSQNTTSDTLETGRRYIEQAQRGNSILLFVRENQKMDSTTSPYVFLGKARYRSHEGSRPMNVIWELEERIPARFLEQWSQLGA